MSVGARFQDRMSAWGSWLPTPDGADFDTRRAYAVARLVAAAVLVHALYVPLFAWWGVWPLAIVNVGSTAFYLWATQQARAGRLQWPVWGSWAEIALHAVLVVALIGWGFGGQYYLLVIITVAFAFPTPRSHQIAVLMACIALFAGLYFYSLQAVPRYDVPDLPLDVLNVANIAVPFALVAAGMAVPLAVAQRAEAALAREHARSERLLTNVLPVPIAARLKDQEEVIADGVADASVLFADLVGFTSLSAQLPPARVVAILDDVFSRLDALVDAFGLEKIKTIGDAYMVASGVPTPREDHAQVLARFALAAREAIADYSRTSGDPLALRIGINSGPMVAGVIGRRRFLYDLWGDAVNTASRMESHGLPGQIQISEATRDLLGEQFVCTERGVIEVKGKGPTRTWFLERERGGVAVEPVPPGG